MRVMTQHVGELLVWPNPAEGSFVMVNESANDIRTVMHDISGHNIGFEYVHASGRITLDIAKWKAGVYRLVDENSGISTKVAVLQ